MSYRILIVEDDLDINQLLARILKDNGYTVTSAYSGSEGHLLMKHETFDCLLLDLMLPGMDGKSLIATIREQHTMPIIVISAMLGTDARVATLRLGADDFIAKPFENEEVLARVEAQLRRSQIFSKSNTSSSSTLLRHKNCECNTATMTVSINGTPIDLTSLEYQILTLLLQHPDRVFTRSNIFTSCWKQEFLGEDNTVDVHISRIRSKIAQYDSEEYIKTVRGIGYRLNP